MGLVVSVFSNIEVGITVVSGSAVLKEMIVEFNDLGFDCSIGIKYLELWLIGDLAYMGIITSKYVMDTLSMSLTLY